MAATKNGTTNIVLNEGTEASPKLITAVVTDINDTTFIEFVSGTNNRVILIKKYIDLSNYWLQIPANIKLIGTGTFYVVMNSTSAGLWLSGGSRIDVEVAMPNPGHFNQFRKGTFKCDLLGGTKPSIFVNVGRSDFPTFDFQTGVPADMIYKIDGLSMPLGAEAHHKFYSSNSNSYVKGLECMRINGYTGAATGLQVRDGLEVSDYISDILSIAGDGSGNANVNRLVRPLFKNQASNTAIAVYPNSGTKVDMIDMKFDTGSWSGKLAAANSGQAGLWGTSTINFKTTLKYTFYSGTSTLSNVKVAYIPTAITGTAPGTAYKTTASDGIATYECLRSAFTTALTVAGNDPNQKNEWEVYSRAYNYDLTFNIYTKAEPSASVSETYQASLNSKVVSTYTEAGNITGVSFSTGTKLITLTTSITTQQLYDRIKWWLFQDAQMNLADFTTVTGTILSLGDWGVVGVENLSSSANFNIVKSTSTITRTTGTSKLVNLYVEDSTGNTKKIIGVNDIYVRIKDNTDTELIAFSKQTADLFIRTETGKTYTALSRRLGYIQKTNTYDASTGDLAVDLTQDLELLPPGTSTTVAELRAQADALTGYVLADNGDLTFPSAGTLANMYLYASRQQEFSTAKTAPEYNGSIMTGAGDGSMAVGATLGISGTGTLKLTGTWNGSLYGSVPIEDVQGVRVIIVKSNNGQFNIYGARGDTNASLGYSSNTTSQTFIVPKGVPVKLASWALGYVTYLKTVDTTAGGSLLSMDMVFNPSINTSLNVDSYIANIDISLASNEYVFTFNAGMSLDLTYMQAIVHRIAGQSTSLQVTVEAGSSTVVEILSDEIKINQPMVYLKRNSNLSNASRVELKGYINTSPAAAINPTYVINPTMPDGTFVVIAFTKPTIDYSLVADYLTESLTGTTKSVTNIEKISSAILGLV